MASTEDKAYEIMRELDVDYVLVIFGGLTGYSSDGEKFHRLNIEVDLQSLFGLHVTGCAQLYSLAETPQTPSPPPIPPHLGPYTEREDKNS
jgi:hypothetical protein